MAPSLHKPANRRSGSRRLHPLHRWQAEEREADNGHHVKVVVPAGGSTRGRPGSGSGGPDRARPARFRTTSPSYIRVRRHNGVGAKLVDLDEDEAAGAGQDGASGVGQDGAASGAGQDGAAAGIGLDGVAAGVGQDGSGRNLIHCLKFLLRATESTKYVFKLIIYKVPLSMYNITLWFFFYSKEVVDGSPYKHDLGAELIR